MSVPKQEQKLLITFHSYFKGIEYTMSATFNTNQHGMNIQSKHLKMNWGEGRPYNKGNVPAIRVSVSEAREWRHMTLPAIAERYGVSEMTAYTTFRSVWGSKSFMNWAMKITGSPVIRRKSTV